jgi:hypothetical protein
MELQPTVEFLKKKEKDKRFSPVREQGLKTRIKPR